MSVKDDLSQMHDRPVAPPKWSRSISHEQWAAMVDERGDRIAELEAALRDVRQAIMEKAPDTLWASMIETAVDRIDAVLCNSDPSR